jgi:hypothetical protein
MHLMYGIILLKYTTANILTPKTRCLCPLCQSQSLSVSKNSPAVRAFLPSTFNITTDKTKTPLLSNPDMLVLQISSYSSRHPRLYFSSSPIPYPPCNTKPIIPCFPPITHLSIMFYSLICFNFRPFILTRISTHDLFCYIPKGFLMVCMRIFLGGRRRQVKMLVVP